MRKWAILSVIAYFVCGGVAQAATYYVSKAGSDSNSGTEGSPFLTVNRGVAQLSAGDTLYVKSGTYDEAFINNLPSGTSWSNPVRIAAYPGHTVWMSPTSNNPTFVVEVTQNQKYIEFDGINMNGSAAQYAVIKIEGWSGGNPHHLRFKNAQVIGDAAHYNQTIILVASAPNIIGGNEFINLRVYAGGATDFDHAFYVQSGNNLFDGLDISNFTGGGIHLYNGYGYDHANNVVRNCVIHDGRATASGQRHWGVIVANGAVNAKIYNNVFYNIPNEGGSSAGIRVFTGSATEVYNNTSYGNGGYGIAVDSYSSNAVVRNNILYANGLGNYSDGGYATVASNNLTSSDPRFVNAAGHDFSLQASSPAINAGTTISVVTNDRNGTARPQGGVYDIGAYEYVAGQVASLSRPGNVQLSR